MGRLGVRFGSISGGMWAGRFYGGMGQPQLLFFCHSVLWFHVSGRGTSTGAESQGGICKWQEDRAIW